MRARQRIGVLTFHRCINYGSYWQARCLTEGLRRRGWDTRLLDHRSRRAERAEWRCALSPLLPAPTTAQESRAYAAKARKFFAAVDALPRSAPFELDAPEKTAACDVVVVGSDEVWNLRHPWYAGCPLFFGEGLRSERLVAYAASFGNYDASAGLDSRWAQRLARFAAIGVRDENSRRLVREAGQEPALTLDPCLLFDDLCRRPPNGSGEVVVYGHSFPDWFAKAARRWADARGARLVSLGYRNAWADRQRLAAGPHDFAQAMADAAAVITNFFHGCVFALVNDKPFACASSDYRANKVTALAKALGADARLISAADAPAALDRALAARPGPEVADRLRILRRDSEAYLEQALT